PVLVMSTRCQCPPPFPYTTLFRSALAGSSTRCRGGRWLESMDLRRASADSRGATATTDAVFGQGKLQLGRCRFCPRPKTASVVADRKSTRLNSSHLGISYAVFCLK